MENMMIYKNSRFGTQKTGWEYAIRGLKGRSCGQKFRHEPLYVVLMDGLPVFVFVWRIALSVLYHFP